MNSVWDKVFETQDVDSMVGLLSELVDIPSETGYEGALADRVAQELDALGADVMRQDVEDGRDNILGFFDTGRPGPTLMFLWHFDTSTNPDDDLPAGFKASAKVEDGWIQGLGVSNMKCAFPAYVSAMKMLRRREESLRGRIIVAGVVGEIEKAPVDRWTGRRYRGGGLGARVMLNRGITADYCINGEPTGLRLQLGNAGYLFVRIQVPGPVQGTHSRAGGPDAIGRAMRLYDEVKAWETRYQEKRNHPTMRPMVNVGAIYGGFPYKPSITPPFCNLYLHVNTVPGERIQDVLGEIDEMAKTECGPDVSVTSYLASNGHEIDADAPVARAVAGAHSTVFGTSVTNPPPERYSVSSDNSPLAEFGIPGVTYGAGGIRKSGGYGMYEPGLGEVVKVDNLAACARVYAVAAGTLLARDGE